jgi:hypothetical protein
MMTLSPLLGSWSETFIILVSSAGCPRISGAICVRECMRSEWLRVNIRVVEYSEDLAGLHNMSCDDLLFDVVDNHDELPTLLRVAEVSLLAIVTTAPLASMTMAGSN